MATKERTSETKPRSRKNTKATVDLDITTNNGSASPPKADIKARANTTKPGGDLKIANHHSAPIVLPRRGEKGMYVPQLTIPAGFAVQVKSEEWAYWKQLKVVQHYLDRGLLAEVRKVGQVGVHDETSTDLVIPEILGGPGDGEISSINTNAKASVRRTNVSEIEV